MGGALRPVTKMPFTLAIVEESARYRHRRRTPSPMTSNVRRRLHHRGGDDRSGANPGARCSVWISAACRNHSQAAGTGITLATKALSMLPAAQAAILQGGFERFQQPSPHWVRKIAGRSIRRRDATTRLTFSHRGGGAGIVRMSGLITLRRSRPQRSVTVTSHAGHRQAESNPRCTCASFPQGLPGVLGPGAVCNRSNFRSHIAKVYARATDKLRNASSSFGRCQERREPVSRPKSKLRLR
jgi:hypothetical protein